MRLVKPMLRKLILLTSILLLTACGGNGGDEVAGVPTDTLVPLFTLTPQLTATPVFTRTPLPTFTSVPSETPIPPTPSNTPSPTPTPPINGIISSLQTVNIREGPGTSFSAFRALVPGTGVEILGRNPDGSWLNVLMEDGDQGWVSATLVFIEPTNTPFPTLTPSPDLTALALGTPLPTAVVGGGTVTPTPPRSAITQTPQDAEGTDEVDDTEGEAGDLVSTEDGSFLPIIDVDAVNLTATALAAGVVARISPPPPGATGQSPNAQPTTDGDNNVRVVTETPTEDFPIPETATTGPTARFPTFTPLPSQPTQPADDINDATSPATTVAPPPPSGSATVQDGADVFAMCNNASFGIPAPTDLAAGSTIDVFWAWYMADPSFIDQHTEAVSYEVRVNGELLSDWEQYGQRVVQVGSNYAKYWYVPYGPLEAGTYTITYRATWDEMITDGFDNFGPGSRNPVEEGSCTFSVG